MNRTFTTRNFITQNFTKASWLLLFLTVFVSTSLKAQTTVTIGTVTGQNLFNTQPVPYGGWFSHSRMQFIITPAELTAAGVTGCASLTAIGFNVTSLTNGTSTVGGHTNFRIRMKNTTENPLSATAHDTAGLIQVLNPAVYTPIMGLNTHTFNTPFAWDGVSNVLVDITHDNGTSIFSASPTVDITALSYNATRQSWSDGQSGILVINPTSTALITAYASRPVVRLTYINSLNVMSFSSATLDPASTAPVGLGQSNQQVLKLKVAVNGGFPAANATVFNFTSTGTTSNADIASARLYNTGLSPTFAPINPVGSVITAPTSSTLTFTATTPLKGCGLDTNYFWLAYNVSGSATPSNILNGSMTGLTVADTARTVTVNPGPGRIILPPLNGTYTIGAAGAFATITSAFANLENRGASGPVTFSLIDPIYSAATGEVFPISLSPFSGMSPARPVVLRPALSNTATVIDSNSTALFIMNGAKYVSIDGRQTNLDVTRNLTLENRSIAASACVVRYINDAGVNTLRNAIVRSANNGTNTVAPVFGSVYIGGTNKAIPTGNDSIIIRNNYFARSANNPYTKAIVSDGQSSIFQNDANTIDSNEFNGFVQNGVFVTPNNAGNGSFWRINSNSFYDTAVTTSTLSALVCINFNPSTNSNSNGNVINGNFIGGNSAGAPMGVGQRWVITGAIGVTGILTSAGTGTGVQITNNIFRSFRIMNIANTAVLMGINPVNPGVTMVSGNIIGDPIDTNSIITNTNSALIGINSTTANDLTITNNMVYNITAAGNGTSTAVRGIVVTTGSNNTLLVSNNTIRAMSTRSTNTGTTTACAWNGIAISSSSPNQTITNNIIGGSNLSDSCAIFYGAVAELPAVSLGGGRMTGIATTVGTNVITNNSIRSLFSQSNAANTTNTSPNIMGILVSTGSSSNLIQNNELDSFILRTGAVGNSIVGITLSSGGAITNNNTMGDFISSSTSTTTSTGASITGINISTSTPQIVSNNTVFGFNNAANVATQINGIVYSTGSGHVIRANTIRNLRSNSTSATAIVGINNQSFGLNNLVSGNTIHSLVSYSVGTGTPGMIGVLYNGSTTIVGNTNNQITRNLIHSFGADNTGTGSVTMTGIQIAGGNSLTSNNIVRIGRDTTGTPMGRLGTYRGIHLSTSGALQSRFLHNTVIVETQPVSGTGTSATLDFAGTATGVGFNDVRNNILINNSANVAGTGNQYIIRSGAANLLNYTINSNLYGMTSSGTNFIGRFNSVDYATLTAWQGGSLMDGSSGLTTIPFVNATGDYASVNFTLAASNPAERGGDITVASIVNVDFLGYGRDTMSPADIGAYGASGVISADVNAPSISYTRLLNTSSPVSRTLTATIVDGGGLPIASTNLPRVYFKKSAGGVWNSAAGTLTAGTRFNGTWTFSINSAAMGGLVAGDSVYYYVIAQDSLGGNVCANAMAAIATDVNTVTVHPANPASYRVTDPLPLTVNVGVGQPYTTITGAGGLFEAINSGILQGNTTALITSDIVEPTSGNIALNRWLEVGTGGYTLTIRPDGASQRIVSTTGSLANGLISLNNVNGFRMLGWSPTGTTADTNLVIRASNTATPALAIVNGGINDTFVNVIFESRNSNTASGTLFVQGTNLPATNGMSNMLIQNCHFRQDHTSFGASFPANGIYMIGTAPRLNTNIRITESQFYNNSAQGINIQTGGGNNWNITNNHFYFTALATQTTSYQAINFNAGQLSDNNNVTGNWIGGRAPFTGGTPYVISNQFVGMAISTGIISGTNVNNNVISNINVTSTSGMTAIFVQGTSSIYTVNGNRIGDYNNIGSSIIFTSTSNNRLQGINSNASGNVTITNDTVVNIINYGVGASAGITGINVASGFSNTTLIDGNIVRNLVLTASTNTGTTTAAALQGITMSSGSLAQTISNNLVQSLVNSNISAHQTLGIQNTSGATKILNNIVKGIFSNTSSTTQAFPVNWSNSTGMPIIGISNYSTTSGTQQVINNLVDSIVCNNAAGTETFGISIGGGFGSLTQGIIQNNIVRNMYTLSNLAAGSVFTNSVMTTALVGIWNSNPSPNQDVSGNMVYNLNHLTNSSSAVLGIAVGNSTSFNGNVSTISRNFVHSIRSTAVSPNVPVLAGIWNTFGIATYSNNMIRMGIDSSGTADTSARLTRAIYQDPLNTTANRYYHNSILIAGTPASGSALSAGIQIGSAIPTVAGFVNRVDIRNNIIANRVNSLLPATGKNYGIRLADSNNIVSNYNIFNITGGNGFVAGTNFVDYAALGGSTTSWSAVTKLDVTSASVDPNFDANALGAAPVATLALQGTNPAERSGDPSLTSVTTDFFGTVRASNTPSDIGAHAGNFNQSPDAFPPVITFTPLVNSGTLSGTRTLSNVTITDNNGIPTSGTTRPRIYYSKDGTNWFSAGASSVSGTSNSAVASFSIDYTPMAPLTIADTIRYYVIAQDNAGNVISNAPYAIAANVNTVTTHPVSPNTYNFLPIIAANSVFQVGTSSTYTSLTGPGGFFEFINSRTLGGSIFADITSDLLNEPGTVSLNQFAEDGAGSGTYTLTIRPVTGTVAPFLIQGNVANALINLNGASRVKITGVPSGGLSTARYLRFRNDNTTASTILIANGAQGVRLNNLIIEGGNTNPTAGVVSLLVTAGTVPCSNDTVSGCFINYNSTIGLPNGVPNAGIYSNGAVGVLNAANVFDNNEISNYLGNGIAVANNNGDGYRITNNSMYNNLPITLAAATQFAGINFFTNNNSSGNVITGNFIGGSAVNAGGTSWNSTSLTTAFIGIRAAVGTGANTLVDNNTIRNINFTNTGTAQLNAIISDNGNIVITNNTIGSTTVNNSIVFANATTHSGIVYQGTNNAIINNNTIAGINIGTAGQTATFQGITATNGGVSSINGNTIGSVLANSIVNNGTGTSTGINASIPVNYIPAYTVNNNVVRNIHMPGGQSITSIRGISLVNSAAPTVSGNSISNLTSNSSSITSTGTTMSVVGIVIGVNSNTIATVTGNNVSALRALNTAATVTPNVTGISLSSGQNTIINGNRIFDLTNASTSTSVLPTPSVAGINVSGGSVNAFATNNQITLGSAAATNTQFIGMWLNINSTSFTFNATHNTVLITGASAGGNQNSYAFLRGNNTASELGTYTNLQNNILANNRTGGTGFHFAIANQTPAPTNNTWVVSSSQYNLLVSADANTLGQWGTSALNYTNWIANATSDARSYYMQSGAGAGQLNLSNLLTSTSNGNLGIQSANAESWYVYGKAVAGPLVNNLATDYAGASRGTVYGFGNTIGSIQLTSVPTATPPAAIASSAPAANTSVSYSFAGRPVATINWGASAPTAATLYNFTGVTAPNQPSGNNANQYLRTDISGGTAPYNYGVVYNYDPALLGAISSQNNMKVSTQTTGSTLATPVWATQPVSTVNQAATTVSAAGLTNSLANMFFTVTENNAPPVVSRFVPATGPVGAAISIFGRNFTGTSALNFSNGVAQPTYTVVNDTTITTTIPAGATTGVVSATNPNGTGISTAIITVIQPPVVSSFTPSAGTFGTVVTISGSNFGTATQVQFNGVNASGFTIVNANTITATVATATTTGLVSVVNPAGTGSSASVFTVYPAPTITTFTPGSGAVGASVTITGTNFNAITNVRFNNVNASYTVNSATSIAAIVPAGATTGAITVVNGSGTATSGTNFTVIQLPTINAFSPSSGGIGTSVVITGTNFTGATAVTFNSTPAASFVVNSSTQITATVAAATASGLIAVTTPAGVATSANNFTVISDLIVSTNAAVSGTYNNITVTATGTANLTGNLVALGNVVVQTGGRVNFGTEVLSGNGNFTTQSGTRLIVGSPAGITGTGGVTGNIQVAGTRVFASAAYIEYNGAAAQAAGDGLSNIDTLIINNANGVTLNSSVTVNTRLGLTIGNLIIGNNNITLGAAATIIGGSATGYVVTNGNGSMRRTVANNATNVTFPIGSTSYTPALIQLTVGSTTDVFGARVSNGVFVTGNNTGSPITNNVVNRTWFISEAVAGGSVATLNVAWDDSLEIGGFNRALCAIARHNGTNYGYIGASPFAAAGLTSGQRTRVVANLTTFGNFAVGDNASPLPVKLISLSAKVASDDVVVSWITASETNNKGFEVERSVDGRIFERVGEFVEGAGNSNVPNNYSLTDEQAFGSANSWVLYYRLKQVDFDGTETYSNIIKVAKEGDNLNALSAYPNPFSSNYNVSFDSKQEGMVTIQMVDLQGKVVNEQTTVISRGLNTVTIDNVSNLHAGIYFVKVIVDGDTQLVKLVKN